MATTFPRATSPTTAQINWLKANPQYIRTSHIRQRVSYEKRGTLHADGTFVPERPGQPVLDGNGAFGVGILRQKRRR